MSLATANGNSLTDAVLTAPRTGAWIFDGVTAEPVDIAVGPVALTVGDIVLSGTVTRSAAFTGARNFRAVGGRSGWTATVQARGYSSPNGLQLAPLLQDAARDAGEVLGPVAANSAGLAYTRRQGPASQVFALLPVGTEWWVDYLGVTQVGARPVGLATAAIQVQDYDGERGVAFFSTDNPAQFLPGKSLIDPTIGTRVINAIVWRVSDGKLRGEAWTG